MHTMKLVRDKRTKSTKSILATLVGGALLGGSSTWAQEQELTLPFPLSHEAFGTSIDVDGDRAAVGSPVKGGVVYALERIDGAWVVDVKIAPQQGSLNAAAGTDVALFGDWLAFGAPGDDDQGSDAGAVYLYRYDGARYLFHQKLFSSLAEPGGFFGMALDGDGALLAVGEPGSDHTAIDVGGAELFELVGDSWIPRQRLVPSFGVDAEYGASIDMDGARIAVGSPGAADSNPGTGRVHVHDYIDIIDSWARVGLLRSQFAEELGRSVAVQGEHVLAGAPASNVGENQPGAVIAFERIGGTFDEVGVMYGIQDGERLGASLSMGRDASGTLRAAAGVPEYNGHSNSTGAVQIFQRLGSFWIPVTRQQPESVAPSARLGTSVIMDGQEVLGGAPQDRVGDQWAGSVRSFDVSTGVWVQGPAYFGRALDPGDDFGSDIAIRGGTAVVGASFDSDVILHGGRAFAFERTGGVWRHSATFDAGLFARQGARFGEVVATDGPSALVAAPFENTRGAAYLFEPSGGVRWNLTARFSPDDLPTEAQFGAALAVDGETAVVGAPGADGSAPGGGAAYVFRKVGPQWMSAQKLTLPVALPNAGFGSTVTLDEGANRLLVAAPSVRMVIPYAFNGTDWIAGSPLSPLAGVDDANFGRSLALAGDVLAVGAGDSTGTSGGAVHLYAHSGSAWMADEAIERTEPYFGARIAYGGERLIAGHRSGVLAHQRFGQLWDERAVAPTGSSLFGFPVAVDLWLDNVMLSDTFDGDYGRVWITRLAEPEPFLAYGFGDGGTSACPCGNESAAGAGEGCANSTGRGALLRLEGSSSIASNDLTVIAEGLPPGRTARLFVGFGRLHGGPFGDGQRLVSSPLKRLALRQSGSDGTARWDVPHGIGFWTPGDVRYFQVFYRDALGAACGSGFNTSSGLAIRFED